MVITLTAHHFFNLEKKMELNLATKPLFKGYTDLFSYRNSLKPKLKGYRKLFMPFCYNYDPVFYGDFEECYFNHEYQPLAVIGCAIRRNWMQFHEIVNSYTIYEEEDYIETQTEFNILYNKLLRGKGERFSGEASEDQVIKLGALFYVLTRTAEFNGVLRINDKSDFLNYWGGEVVDFHVDKNLYHYAKAFKNSVFSGMDWNYFITRYSFRENDLDRDSVLYVHLPTLSHSHMAIRSSLNRDFHYDDLGEMISDYLKPVYNHRRCKIILCFEVDNSPNSEGLYEDLFEKIRFEQQIDERIDKYFELTKTSLSTYSDFVLIESV